MANLTPRDGIVDYEPNVSFWSDYASKRRWFGIKNTTDTMGFSADGKWTLPAAMVWVKHFDIDLQRGNSTTRRKLETRFLVKTATDVYGLSYKWNNVESGAQTDASLVVEEGENFSIPTSKLHANLALPQPDRMSHLPHARGRFRAELQYAADESPA